MAIRMENWIEVPQPVCEDDRVRIYDMVQEAYDRTCEYHTNIDSRLEQLLKMVYDMTQTGLSHKDAEKMTSLIISVKAELNNNSGLGKVIDLLEDVTKDM